MGLTCSCKTCGNRHKKRRNKRRIAADSRQSSSSTTETSHHYRSGSMSPEDMGKNRSSKRPRISVLIPSPVITELSPHQPKQENIYYQIPVPPTPVYTPLSSAEEIIVIEQVSRSFQSTDSIMEPDVVVPVMSNRLHSSLSQQHHRLSIASISSSCVDLAGGFYGSDLPLKPLTQEKPESCGSFDMSEEAIRMCLNKPSYWVQEVEMRLKYLEGQTDSHLFNLSSNNSIYNSQTSLNKDEENISDEISQIIDSIKNRLNEFERQYGEESTMTGHRRESILNNAMGIDNLMRRLHKKNVTLVNKAENVRKSENGSNSKIMSSIAASKELIEASKEKMKQSRSYIEKLKQNQNVEKKEVPEVKQGLSKWQQLKERQKAMDIAKVFKSRPFNRPEEPPISSSRPKYDPNKSKELIEQSRKQMEKTKSLLAKKY